MANGIYTKFFEQLAISTGIDWDSGVIRCLLERDTSLYSFNKDHDFVSDLASLVEISVASYARQTMDNAAVNIDDANDRVELDFDDEAGFGSLESGQNVESLIFYYQVGGDDSTPANDPLIARIDTATGLPATLGGGPFNITLDAQGLIQLAQP